MQNGAPQPTPPPSTVETAHEETTATIVAEDDPTYNLADTLTEAALSVLDNVLALL